jgi:SAM-dependent methyltransferase
MDGAQPLPYVRAEGESRSPARLREHYRVERELADRLRKAPAHARKGLYKSAYEELFRTVRDHPQLLAQSEIEVLAQRQRAVSRQLKFLGGMFTPQTTFMEIGAGDCALAVAASALARRVYAIDVAEEITRRFKRPQNCSLVLSDGCSVPLPDASVDLAFSDQLMEHLHPEDAEAQLREIFRCLAPGGRYVCITPNRLYGPSDISGYFDEVATGLHLREYSAGELRAILKRAGFRRLRFYAGARGLYLRVPYALVAAAEGLLEALPHRLRRRIAGWLPMRALLGVRVSAQKPESRR